LFEAVEAVDDVDDVDDVSEVMGCSDIATQLRGCLAIFGSERTVFCKVARQGGVGWWEYVLQRTCLVRDYYVT